MARGIGIGTLGLIALGAGAVWMLSRKRTPIAAPAGAQPASPAPPEAQMQAGGAGGAPITGWNVSSVLSTISKASGEVATALAGPGFGNRPLTALQTNRSLAHPRPGTLTFKTTPSMPSPKVLSGMGGFGQAASWRPGQLYQGGTHDTSSNVQGLWF